MFKQLIPIALLVVMITGCTNTTDPIRDRYRWLSGNWEGKDGETTVIESWKWDRYRFVGEGYRIDEGDTSSWERLFITSYGPVVGYTALLNDEALWCFQVSEHGAASKQLLMSNPRNDFPKQISYILQSDSSLQITLEGEMHGSPVKTSYRMLRKSRER